VPFFESDIGGFVVIESSSIHLFTPTTAILTTVPAASVNASQEPTYLLEQQSL
jgi:hypothetical protein